MAANITTITDMDVIENTGITATGAGAIFEVMVDTADATLGVIEWFRLDATFAVGRITGQPPLARGPERVAVIDLDVADGMAVIRIANWVNGHSTEAELFEAIG